MKIQPESIVFDTEGGKDIAVISSSDAWTARIINGRAESWCSIEPASGEAGDTEMTVTVQANETPDERSASVVVTCGDKQKTIVVTQKQKDALTVTASRFDIGAEGGSIAVEVKANIDFEYIIEETAKEWLEYETTKAMNSSTLVFTVAPNESLDKREGAIAIQSGDLKETITVYQEGEKPSIVISQNNYNVAAAGGDIAIEVSSNVDVTVQMPESASWIRENATKAMSTNTYHFLVDENTDSRYAGEGLGAYEGALYATGVYRPTENSMMNNQNETPYFNAPSREAIYYRIHKLAYGEDWEYDYETFVEYDAVNRTSAALSSIRRLTNTSQEIRKLTAPPTIIVRQMK